MAQSTNYPKRYNFSEIEKKWIKFWKENKIYAFNIEKEGPIFSIDTPPPFTSGDLHMGHVLNHSWIDFVGRFRKMRGMNVYFPQGFDCHGLPTELAVAVNYKIDKSNRELFLEKCIEWTENCINQMRRQFDELGYSTDWDYTYKTMDDSYKRQVQESLLDYYEKGWLYRAKHPTHYCMNCQTSVAKAEVGYKEEPGKLWYLKLPIVGREDEHIIIATTRPEYMEACVGVFVHPNDERFYDLSAAEVEIPLTGRTVRIRMDRNVDMNFGTGIVYCCTYGDELDIKWKLEHDLDEITIFTDDGHMNEKSKYNGLTILEAREKIVKDLDDLGFLEKIEDYEHRVVVHTERSSCKKPIEYIPVQQWFIKVREFTGDIIKSSENMKWFPEKHKVRLIDWCESLDWDWVISRQRVFGTPIPFWYCNDCGEIFTPKRADLPVDPAREGAPLKECSKCNSKEIIGESSVCDCWIDSSITPLAISKWKIDDSFFDQTYMKAQVHRPQGYEIIRTWLFYTIFRCKKLTGKDPFSEVMINGMVAGPDGRKMSKSFGNIVSPDEVLPLFGSDAIRQWAAMGSLGDDYPFEYSWIELNSKQVISKEKIEKERENLPLKKFNNKYRRKFNQLIGAQKFLTKIWNAYRFLNKDIELNDLEIDIKDLSPIDAYFYNQYNVVLKKITDSFEGYNWHEGFAAFRTFFWSQLCDDYIEAIKWKFYEQDDKIRQSSLKTVLNLMLRVLKILAFISPFMTEEIYSILFQRYTNKKSIHLEMWPEAYDGISESLAEQGKIGIDVIKTLRWNKATNKIPLNQELSKVVVVCEEENVNILQDLALDIKNIIRIRDLQIINKNEEGNVTEKPEIDDNLEELKIRLLIFK